MNKRGTLDGAGYTYNPFTQNDIWGMPSQLAMQPLTSKELPVGADDSAIPQMATAEMRRGAPQHATNISRPPPPPPPTQAATIHTQSLIAFIAIVALALFVKVP